jgi:hypothetical protein
VGGTLRILALIDEFTKQCVGHYVARSINAQDVMRTLAQAISEHGAPAHIRSDNGSEFIARTVRDGLALRGIKTLYIDPGSPWQNGFIESFNDCARRELLDREQFYTLSEARVVFAGWIDDYNAYRPHGAIGYLTPHELMGGTPGLRPSGLTQEPSKTTLLEATQLQHYGWPHKPSPITSRRKESSNLAKQCRGSEPSTFSGGRPANYQVFGSHCWQRSVCADLGRKRCREKVPCSSAWSPPCVDAFIPDQVVPRAWDERQPIQHDIRVVVALEEPIGVIVSQGIGKRLPHLER